jgi:preprotein translocase subunit SecF
MKIIQKRKIFFVLSGMLISASLIFLFLWGLHPGIDFTGGMLMEIGFTEQLPNKEDLQQKLNGYELGDYSLQYTGDKSVLLRFPSNSDEKGAIVSGKIEEDNPGAEVQRVEFISSVISSELKSKAFLAVIFAIIGIAAYIAWAFRKVSFPVQSWKYGLAAIIALIHDIIITLGLFALFGKFFEVEVGIPFIAALLTILGYSVNDTIIVFDRIRENLLRAGAKENFEETVNNSINETLARSINTSLTVILVLLSIFFFGGQSIQYFSLALLVGVFFGTYSSIFIASAALVEIWKRKLDFRK